MAGFFASAVCHPTRCRRSGKPEGIAVAAGGDGGGFDFGGPSLIEIEARTRQRGLERD